MSTYSPNVLNQAAGSYDSNGNRIETSAAETLVYDAQDQLVTMYKTNTWRVDFVYDGQQRLRVIKDYTAGSGGSWTLQNSDSARSGISWRKAG